MSEAQLKKYVAVIVATTGVVVGGAVWATKVSGDLDALKAADQKQESAIRDAATEIRLLREAMIRAGTALPEPK